MALFAASERKARLDDVLGHDVRGWKVKTRLDRVDIGRVDEVLLDEDGVPRHLDVELAHDDRHVLLPVGHATVEPSEEILWLPGLARDTIGEIPDYPGDPAAIGPEYESTLGVAWDRAYGPDAFYASPHFSTEWGGHHTSGEREVAAGAPKADAGNEVRVDTLDDIDVAEHSHDPRGWTVVGRDGAALGRVEHLMGDLRAMKVRYLTVVLDHDDVEEGRRILVPAGHAELEPDRKRVRVDALDPTRLGGYPAWTGEGLEREHERRVAEHLGSGYEGAHRYRHPRYRTEHLRESRPGSKRET